MFSILILFRDLRYYIKIHLKRLSLQSTTQIFCTKFDSYEIWCFAF